MADFIPYGRQSIDEADIAAVVAVLRSDWLTQGPAVPAFENEVARICQARHAVAVNSATSALHLACLALDVGPGDWVWTTSISFVASANCALYCGAQVDFVDIDPRTYNLCPLALEEKLKVARQQGRLPKALIAVHLCGQPCDMRSLHKLSLEYGFRIIEDASHAVGARYLDQPVGNCQYSEITVFSFHPVKIITSAEGGMALTNDPALARRMQKLRSHGITREETEMTEASHGPWYYQQTELGFNYRMTDLQAALGLSQLAKLESFVEKRRVLAKRYDRLLSHLPVVLPWQDPATDSSWHLYIIRLAGDTDKAWHKDVFEKLRKEGIGVNLHYIPIHLQPFHKKRLQAKTCLPEAEYFYQSAISLPLFAGLNERDQDRVVHAFESVLQTSEVPA